MNISVHYEPLRDLDGTLWVNKTFTSGAAIYSAPIDTRYDYGDSQGLFIIIGTGSADLDISYVVGLEAQPATASGGFFTPFDTSGNNVGTIATAVTASRYVELDCVVAPYMRLYVDPDGTGLASIYYICNL